MAASAPTGYATHTLRTPWITASQTLFLELCRYPPVNATALRLGLRNSTDTVSSPATTCGRKPAVGRSHSPTPRSPRRLLIRPQNTLFGVGLSASQPATPELVNGFVPTGGPNGELRTRHHRLFDIGVRYEEWERNPDCL